MIVTYCFLQGMFNSANYLVFVNYEDYFKEIKKNNKLQIQMIKYVSFLDMIAIVLH